MRYNIHICRSASKGSSVDHHIPMCRILLPGGVASQSWLRTSPWSSTAQKSLNTAVNEVRNTVRTFKLCSEIPLLNLISTEMFPDAKASQWLRRLVYGLSLRRLDFDPRPATCDLLWTDVIGTGIFPPASVLPCHCHSTNAPHSLILSTSTDTA